MFQFLNGHYMFRRYCNDLYPLFREEHGLHEKTIFDFLHDNGLKDLNIDKAARFFWFCGVIHESDAQITWNTVPKSCSQQKHICNSLDKESAALYIKHRISVMCKK